MQLLHACWHCGPLLIATAAFSFSLTALLVKFIGDSIPPFETLSTSGVLCLFGLSGFLTHIPLLVPARSALEHPGERPSDVGVWAGAKASRASAFAIQVTVLTLLRAAFGTLATTSFYLSLELLSLKDAVTLFFISPVIAIFLEWVVVGRRPGLGGTAATGLTLAGALLVTQPPCLFLGNTGRLLPDGGAGAVNVAGHRLAASSFTVSTLATTGSGDSANLDGSSLDPVGVALALLAAAANASGFMAVNLLRGRQHPLALTWWYNLVLAGACAVPLAFRWPLPPRLPSARGALLLLGVGATQLAAQLCLNRGFQLENAGRGAAINVLQVLFSFLLDVVVLGDKPSALSAVGSSLVAAGVLFVALTPSTAVSPAVGMQPHSGGGAAGDAVAARQAATDGGMLCIACGTDSAVDHQRVGDSAGVRGALLEPLLREDGQGEGASTG